MFVTATLTPVPEATTTRTTTTISRSDTALLGLRSIVEALRFVPGLDVRARGPRDVQTDFSIRGATFGQHLVLADGMRLNDSQSGHHNGELPLPAVAIDRVEIVAGAGSAVHGADALGGTINVLTRRDPHAVASVAIGQHGLVDAQASAAGGPLPPGWTIAGWASRSSGFMFDRDFALGGGAIRGELIDGLTVDVRHQRRAFGANGFYGNSPSKEWTDLTMGAGRYQRAAGAWLTSGQVVVRSHGDHFRWDINRPGFAENRHRTYAIDTSATGNRLLGRATLTLGGSAGVDRVDSSNLGDHRYTRVSGFAELQAPFAAGTSLVAGLRLDDYSTFGTSVSPSVSFAAPLTASLRLRASAGHAFRIPTFTELYYSDPNTLGRQDLRAERGWTIDGGIEWSEAAWSAAASVFGRWDEDVIDFVRPAPGQRFQATNIRDVSASGVELSLARRWASALVRASYTGLAVDAPELTGDSRYVLEYARHQTTVSLAGRVGAGVRGALNVDHYVRRDGQQYALVSARVSRAFGRLEVFVDGANMLDETYTEVAGVAMPGRWLSGGVTIR